MLLTRRTPPRAWFVPVLGLIGGGAFTVLLAAQLVSGGTGVSRLGALLGALFFGAVTWLFVRDIALMTIEGGRLVIRGPRRERAVAADRCRIGVIYRRGGRMASFALLVTDSDATVEVGEWSTSKGADAAAAGIERAFGIDPGAPSREKATRAVERMERRWQGELEKGQAAVDAYYQSAAWRRVKYGGPLLVLLYIAVMAIYIRFWGS